MTPIPLVYVGGTARSGSTLLERMLAGIPGICPVGEIAFIWDRCLKRNDRCGCGARFHDCEFWTQVGQAGFGGWDRVDADEAARLHATVDRHRHFGQIAGLRPPGQLQDALSAYRALTDRLYRAVGEVSGAPVIIDSSKSVGHALLLRSVPSIEFRLVHLIRRSHGVAHSWSRPVRKSGVGDGSSSMSVHPASWAVSLWIADNLLYEALARRTPLSVRVRYEDVVAEPRAELVRIVSGLGLPAADLTLGFLDGTSAHLQASHALSGNPMRSQQGKITLRADDEWRTAMSGPRRALITAATWPLLRHYGYSTTVPAQPHS
jgi:hypothetical protein